MNFVAQRAQRFSTHLANPFLVLDQQDGFVGPRDRQLFGMNWRDCNLRGIAGARQIELDRRALADLAIDADMSARLAGEPMNLAEPEACTLARCLGGEKGLERLGRNSLAGTTVRVPEPRLPISVRQPRSARPSADL